MADGFPRPIVTLADVLLGDSSGEQTGPRRYGLGVHYYWDSIEGGI